MEHLQFKVSFDDTKIEKKNLRKEDIYYTIKKHFLQRGLRFVPDDKYLIFENTGRSTDYGHMWAIIMALLKCDWFTDCASDCVFIEDGEEEDILSQLPRVKQIMAMK